MKKSLFIPLFYVILILLNPEIENKFETTIITSQSKSKNFENAANCTTDNSMTKVDQIPKSNVEEGMLKYNHS